MKEGIRVKMRYIVVTAISLCQKRIERNTTSFREKGRRSRWRVLKIYLMKGIDIKAD